MANPIDAEKFIYVLDPSDVQEFYAAMTRGPLDGDWLTEDDKVVGFTVFLPLEAVAAGLTIVEDDDHQTRMANDVIAWAVTILPARRGETLFLADGVELPIRLSADIAPTEPGSNQPPSAKYRTIILIVRKR